jgi:hypothetical protein
VGALALLAAVATYGSAQDAQGAHGWVWPLLASAAALIGVLAGGWGAAAASTFAYRHHRPANVTAAQIQLERSQAN